eukprot:scaffold74122_cov36-Phaeocystis_antarctica.AAC.1
MREQTAVQEPGDERVQVKDTPGELDNAVGAAYQYGGEGGHSPYKSEGDGDARGCIQQGRDRHGVGEGCGVHRVRAHVVVFCRVLEVGGGACAD